MILLIISRSEFERNMGILDCSLHSIFLCVLIARGMIFMAIPNNNNNI
jgi:hypothetical protein